MRSRLCLLVAAAALLLVPGVATAATAPVVFGHADFPGERGLGRAHPRTVDFNGDGAGNLFHLRWRHWGARHATATGRGTFLWPGQSVADGSVPATVHVVLSRIRRCHGVRAYTRMVRWVPQYGERRHDDAWQDLCGLSFPENPKLAACASTRLPDGTRVTHVQATFIDCAGAAAVIAAAAPTALARSGPDSTRFAGPDGFLCGTDGASASGGPFGCGRDREQITFVLGR